MVKVLENIFASYYFLYVKKRGFEKRHHFGIFRDRSEDSGALATLIVAQMFLIATIAGIIRKIEFFVLPKQVVWPVLILYVLAIIVQQQYFVSNRDRRRAIIENFRDLPEKKKKLWLSISIGIIVVPLISFIFLLKK